MTIYLIERTIPGAGEMDDDAWHHAAAASNQAVADVGPGLRWSHSYVTADKVFCIYEADDVFLIHRHGECGGFPVDAVHAVVRQVDPATGERATPHLTRGEDR